MLRKMLENTCLRMYIRKAGREKEKRCESKKRKIDRGGEKEREREHQPMEHWRKTVLEKIRAREIN